MPDLNAGPGREPDNCHNCPRTGGRREALANHRMNWPGGVSTVHLIQTPGAQLDSTESLLDLLPPLNIRRVTVSLPPLLIARLDKMCEKEDLNRSCLVKLAVEGLVDQLEKIHARKNFREAGC